MVKQVGTPDFPRELVTFSHDIAGVDHCSAIWISPNAIPPALLFTYGMTIPDPDAQEVAQRYADRSRQDPNYRKAIGMSARQDGTLLPFPRENVEDSSYVQYFYTEVGVIDKVSTVTNVRNYKILSNFYRLSPSSPYNDTERDVLRDILPLAAGLIGAHFQIAVLPAVETAQDALEQPKASGPQDIRLLMENIDEAFSGLSERERQVCEGIVLGHSATVLAESLDVSPATIVTYRRRAYTKLGVNSANDLLRLLITSLDPPPL